MPYPFWNVAAGYGIIMAAVAVIHVFVSHFAIGGGLYLILSERSARRSGDDARLRFTKRLSRFFVLLTLVFGALTGVGIWFVIGLLQPAATQALIRNFVWAWAIEWTFFVVEILAAILYLYGWDRMPARKHMAIGWIYFVAAWLSLVVITGIICFMLTPGEWLQSGGFWDGFLNPTYASSVALRTGICVLMAGLFTLLVGSRERDAGLRARLARSSAVWGVVGLVICTASWFWLQDSIPEAVRETVGARLSIPAIAEQWLVWLSTGLLALLLLQLVLGGRRFGTSLAAVSLVAGLAWFGSFEWYRESIRKPFVIQGWMYGNGVKVGDAEDWRETGLLGRLRFRSGDDGADLFMYSCRHCHTIDGYNPLRPAFEGTDVAYVRGVIMNLTQLKGSMPPFPGSAEEAGVLADWLWKHVAQRPFAGYSGLTGTDLGEKVYEQRCGRCHELGGFNDKLPKLADYEDSDIDELLQDEEGLEGMPPFTGSAAERKAVIDFMRHRFSNGGN